MMTRAERSPDRFRSISTAIGALLGAAALVVAVTTPVEAAPLAAAAASGPSVTSAALPASAASPAPTADLSGATAVAAGERHTCSIVAGGQVRCWGDNAFGQIGNGATGGPTGIPTAVSGLSGATQVAAGREHTCAIVAGGQVRCWGNNAFGQLGTGSIGGLNAAPTGVTGLSGATQIAAGAAHTCVIVAGGQVRCWGANDTGQLGSGPPGAASGSPIGVEGLSGATGIAAGSNHTCVIVTGGQARCWGANDTGQLGNGSGSPSGSPVSVGGLTGATRIAAGGFSTKFDDSGTTCAVVTGGQVRCWGDNSTGQLGNGTFGSSSTPVGVTGLSGATVLAMGDRHVCALVTSGQARCWGANSRGELGNGTSGSASPTIVSVTGVSGAVGVALSGGGDGGTSCVVLAVGGVRCWGDNSSGELGVGTVGSGSALRVGVTGLSGAVQIAGGSTQTCALVDGGKVRCWGANSSGQLGNATTIPSPTPVSVGTVTGATRTSAGGEHGCALVSGGQGRCWGRNEEGQLGNGTPSATPSTTPVAVTGLSGAIRIAAGNRFTCALVSGGQSRCWGANDRGQLGNGTTTTSSTLVAVTGLSGAVELGAGGRHVCAIVAGGQVRCWGANDRGQLGNGTSSAGATTTPVTVSGLSGATRISAGAEHTCVVLSGGQVRCWGGNTRGQLGNGTSSFGATTSPVTVAGLTGAVDVAAGGEHTCALLNSGQARCWGSRDFGQLGDGITGGPVATSPVGVAGLSGATGLASGSFHTCAIVAGGQARCWGANGEGAIGLLRFSPAAVAVQA